MWVLPLGAGVSQRGRLEIVSGLPVPELQLTIRQDRFHLVFGYLGILFDDLNSVCGKRTHRLLCLP